MKDKYNFLQKPENISDETRKQVLTYMDKIFEESAIKQIVGMAQRLFEGHYQRNDLFSVPERLRGEITSKEVMQKCFEIAIEAFSVEKEVDVIKDDRVIETLTAMAQRFQESYKTSKGHYLEEELEKINSKRFGSSSNMDILSKLMSGNNDEGDDGGSMLN